MTIKEAALLHSIIEKEIDTGYFPSASEERLKSIIKEGVINASLEDLRLIFEIIEKGEKKYRKEYDKAKKTYEELKREYDKVRKEFDERDKDIFMSADEINMIGDITIRLVRALDSFNKIKTIYEDYQAASRIEL